MNNDRASLASRADYLGIVASALCFVHCILTPVVVSVPAVWAHDLPSDERLHRVLALIVAAAGTLAVVKGYRRHRRFPVILLITSGLLLIFVGAYLGDRLPSHPAELAITTAGSSLLIAAHILNHTFCKTCRRCE